MTTEGSKRKLAAILSADVKEYSRLMSQDERGTIRTLTEYKEAMSKLIQEYKGRVVDAPGDNLLAEFGSVIDAVNCAVEIQRELAERNAELPPARQMEFRIGINLGDIVEEERRIYGDGVNIAARGEGLAEGGGICISGKVYEEVKSKLGLEYEYLGEQEVKNIPEPVGVYRVLSFPGAAAHRVVKAKTATERKWRKTAFAAGAVVVLGVGALLIWNFLLRPTPPRVEPASVEKMAYPLPEKPSIAVLPFDNLSDDPTQDHIVDGITDAIITGLSRTPGMFVIARNSVFTSKGKPVEIRQVSEELGVRYVLEGSVQKTEEQLRINAQLIDAIKGHHLWAEKYDRDLKGLFSLQDEITMKIITELGVKLTEGEQARIYAKGTENLDAYVKLLKGRKHKYRFNKEGNAIARKMFEEAIALDPKYSMAYGFLASTHQMDVLLGLSKSPRHSLARAIELVQKAIALDDSNAGAHGLLSWLFTFKRQYDKAIAEAELAVAIDPNSADAHAYLGLTLHFVGRYEEAIALLNKAIRLNPTPPTWYFLILGNVYQVSGRFDESIEAYKKVLHRNPDDLLTHTRLAASYGLMGREEEALDEAAEVWRIDPKFSAEQFAKKIPYEKQRDVELILDGLRKAGLK
jgi:adenylate cyclase